MPCPGVGPCSPWTLDLSCYLVSGSLPDPCLSNGTPVPQSVIDSATLAASQLVWALTGRQFGCCEVTVRPCRKKCLSDCCLPSEFGWDMSHPWVPVHQADGTWTNITCGCNDECSCVNLSEINLPTPICSVSQVLIDGIVVDPATYRVDNFSKLVRLGTDVWPTCNDLTKADTEVGTWSVTLIYGVPVPELALLAANEMAIEIIKNCVGQPCKLPQRLQSISRQQVSATFLDPMEFLDKGLTGLYFVDLAARTFNPNRLQRRPRVFSPDSLKKWRVSTWQNGDPITGCS